MRALDSMGLTYKHNSTYEGLTAWAGVYLRFDFIIAHGEQTLVIEYDGEQHFRPVRFGGMSEENAKERLEKTQRYDNLKNEYCLKQGYPLLRISYKEFGNIPQLVTAFFVANTDWGVETSKLGDEEVSTILADLTLA